MIEEMRKSAAESNRALRERAGHCPGEIDRYNARLREKTERLEEMVRSGATAPEISERLRMSRDWIKTKIEELT